MGTPPVSLARITYLVKWVEFRLRCRMDSALERHALTTPEYTALSVLQLRSGLSSAQLARRTLVNRQAANHIVASLEGRRLIRRSPDPEHEHVPQFWITERGMELLLACSRAADDVESNLLAELTADEVVQLRGLLGKCLSALKESE